MEKERKGDLISRSALLEWVNNQKAEATGVYGNIITAAIDAVMKHNVANAIRKAPAVDAEPVRHGRWVHREMAGLDDVYYCSVCGERAIGYDGMFGDYFSIDSDYCPHCGATMDGGNDE